MHLMPLKGTLSVTKMVNLHFVYFTTIKNKGEIDVQAMGIGMPHLENNLALSCKWWKCFSQ